MRNKVSLEEELNVLRELVQDYENFLVHILPWYKRIFAGKTIQKFLLSSYQRNPSHVWGMQPSKPWPKPVAPESEVLVGVVNPLKEGDWKKGGTNPPPKTPKPRISPPGQGVKS